MHQILKASGSYFRMNEGNCNLKVALYQPPGLLFKTRGCSGRDPPKRVREGGGSRGNEKRGARKEIQPKKVKKSPVEEKITDLNRKPAPPPPKKLGQTMGK